MIILTLLALLISGGAAPVFIGVLLTYDLLFLALVFRKKIFSLFKLKMEG